MTKTYNIKTPSKAAEAAADHRAKVAMGLSLGAWSGGEIANAAQLAGALVAKAKAEKVIKAFTAAAKAWVDEHGPVIGEDNRTWGPSTTERETKCGLSLTEMRNLLADCGVPAALSKKIINALRRRGVGDITVGKRYGWMK
jgi:hypothetical protein